MSEKNVINSKQSEIELKFVCRSGCGDKKWNECGWITICPHSTNKDEDFDFSIRAHEALCGLLEGKYATKADAARAHGISIRNFYLYRKTCGYIDKSEEQS